MKLMGRYINKDTLMAEINKLKDKAYPNSDWNHGYVASCEKILSFLNTLEVKEVDLENSMVCKVGWYDGFFLDYTQEQQDSVLKKIGVTVGDKVKVLVIKQE